ncbi:hypothetical protein CLAFUW4_04424 [Fulvia fulva]|uniref:Uncharacterized protein n=1 Tax=Passalora fulva TaxID=5499 RepID=A0A9Q8LFL3_PASFU|nr:uncharacterized protein CLAFUR5_04387 [Fulvia fulva]KAK4626720.1 hypothetical protein CLAFUR4_04410 [Fulvia fulva]KAK4627767.1 hypothetical protein CLAFUR0_04412 [Fulvia fulva]UJO16504.1 hypothetical protein CLAFUR5_04387 [Fulvia fulva]WPV13521.1 hypothetical protein CLAFUW4_04424 [Fulvia fulva]WPV29206.1 hypothetical protein CLAFUW7_04414 [Fulvia fulva]
MPPLVEAFPASDLAPRINDLPSGKKRKPAVADLKSCPLQELIQYNCNLNGPRESPQSKVVCEPVLRLFRQCANGMTVETTAWEGRYDQRSEVRDGDHVTSTTQQQEANIDACTRRR